MVVRNPRAVVPAAREEVVARPNARPVVHSSAKSKAAQADDAGGGGRREGGRGGGGERRREGQRPSCRRRSIKQSDTNGDGKLSKDEAPEPMKAFFDMADADKDGFITTAELAAGMKAMGGGGGGGQRGGPPAGRR